MSKEPRRSGRALHLGYVPQDTVLGPTLFKVFINDITEAVQKRGFLSPPIQLSTEFSPHPSRVCLQLLWVSYLVITTSTLSYISKNQALKNKHKFSFVARAMKINMSKKKQKKNTVVGSLAIQIKPLGQ